MCEGHFNAWRGDEFHGFRSETLFSTRYIDFFSLLLFLFSENDRNGLSRFWITSGGMFLAWSTIYSGLSIFARENAEYLVVTETKSLADTSSDTV
jgi:hypothetical protein